MNIPKLRTPIVLVHGMFGFDRLKWFDYFWGIPPLLRDPGNRVLTPALTPTDGTAVRARQLKDFINRESPHEPVHIIAHSLGGLDARYMISCLGMAKRVLTLTTLGTPHRGTTFAAIGIQWLSWVLKPLFRTFQVPTEAFYDVTPARCKIFNEKVLDVPGVRYFSVAGQHDGRHLVHPFWTLPYSIVHRAEGPNDGVVSVASATYGESVEVWDGDHMSLVNWPYPLGRHRAFGRDPGRLYGPLVRRLADEGY